MDRAPHRADALPLAADGQALATAARSIHTSPDGCALGAPGLSSTGRAVSTVVLVMI